METDWSVAAGAEDPVIETGWRDDAAGTAWSELRVAPNEQERRIGALPEVAAAPALAHALSLLNAPGGMLLTTKCDRWLLDAEERAQLADLIDAPVPECGAGSYIDVLMAHAVPMADFLLHEEWARVATRRAAALEHAAARMEIVVRPAQHGKTWGYGLTIYHYAGGASRDAAEAAWSAALKESVPLLVAAADTLLAPADEALPAAEEG